MAFLSTHTTSAFLEGQVREIGIGIVIGVVLIFTELMVLGTGDVDHVKARHFKSFTASKGLAFLLFQFSSSFSLF